MVNDGNVIVVSNVVAWLIEITKLKDELFEIYGRSIHKLIIALSKFEPSGTDNTSSTIRSTLAKRY